MTDAQSSHGARDELVAQADELGKTLAAAGLTLATAESCTGGMLGAVITAVPGSSAYYLGGAIAYDNTAKVHLVGVAETVLKAHGAVSPEAAVALAHGARATLGADLAVSVTGIAGPGGATEDKPVGLVYIGFASDDERDAAAHYLQGDRRAIRRGAVGVALDTVHAAAASLTTTEPPRSVAGEPRPPPETPFQPVSEELEPGMYPEAGDPDAPSVQAVFQPTGEVMPLVFRWRGKDHRVAQVGGVREERGRRVFTVMTPSARMFELVLERESLRWAVRPVGPQRA